MKFAVDLHNPVISSAIGNVNSSAVLKSAAGVFHGLQGQDLARYCHFDLMLMKESSLHA